ncbi:LMBR1-like conserved region-containing protein [Cavenderia fasciculata]|uniref:LMBR1-like conserved region-containing protein n=1 Tax=Cavenderia fasciculata TaxID=261658 RepID=F4Q3L8_CACFS|nr:LMBR1-like conserved region-containing protein [Cavenderia fasciculata]EGG17676.1 LMBR1-like conserved region-containing protein [Cavenderia fasciculata]|eukprot:XP_004356160.1 LMBR1-like conserved region-containing protein [Cavenderia fasciculata]
MLPIAIGYASFGVCIVVILALNYLIVKYYSDKHEAEKLTTVVAVLGLTITLLCLFIIPVDILNVSTMSDQGGNVTLSTSDINFRNDSIRIIYYVLYALILGFALVLIPFAYFYFEEYDEGLTTCQRVYAGCKYTTFLIVFMVVLLIVGAFIRPGSSKPVDNQNVKDWIQDEIMNQNAAEASLMFAIACLTLLGFIVWISYTAYGLSAMPMGLIKGKRRVSDDRDQIDSDLSKTRERVGFLSSKNASGKNMSSRDEANLSLLQSRERALQRRSSRLDGSEKGIKKILVIFRPFSFIFGFVFLLVSFLIVISIVLSIIDKLTSSVCGSSCGFLTTYPKLKNPVDLLLSLLAPYFPLDFIILGLLITFVYFSTLAGIVRIGIRFIWIKMYEFLPRRTAPQGLLMATVLLMLANLCMNVQILTLAPRYGMFGTQVWFNATSQAVSPCSLDAPPNACQMTQIGVLSSRIQMGTSFFGIVYYYATWVFVGTFLIGLVVSLIRKRQSNVVAYRDDSDEDF